MMAVRVTIGIKYWKGILIGGLGKIMNFIESSLRNNWSIMYVTIAEEILSRVRLPTTSAENSWFRCNDTLNMNFTPRILRPCSERPLMSGSTKMGNFWAECPSSFYNFCQVVITSSIECLFTITATSNPCSIICNIVFRVVYIMIILQLLFISSPMIPC